jgi:uncharacterized protein
MYLSKGGTGMEKRSCMRGKWIFLFVVVSLLSWTSLTGAQTKRISIATGGTGGVYYIFGSAIAKVVSKHVPNTQATAEATPGGIDNLKFLQNNSADLALAKSEVMLDAIQGTGHFSKTGKIPIRAITALYADICHVVVNPKSGITKFQDLMGKRVSTGDPGSGHELLALKLLEAAGLNPEKDIKRVRISIRESADAFKDRKLDAFIFATGLPAAAMLDLGATPGLDYKILDLEQFLKPINDRYGSIYDKAVIPKATYGNQDYEAKTMGVPVLLVTMESADEKLIYDIVKSMYDFKPELVAVHKEAAKLTLQNAILGSPAPFHPGAIKFYREQGVWKK